MTTYPAQIDGLEMAALPPRPLHLAVGMFDGVHLGHRAVVGRAVQAARQRGDISGVLTFWPHPSTLVRPDSPTRLLQDAATKSRMLLGLGVDVVITESFSPELAAVEAEDFVAWLKERLPRLAGLYVGENFHFGRARRGDVALLMASGRDQGVEAFSARPVTIDAAPVSSTRIRAHLVAGEIKEANALLGYAYFAEGVVTPGRRLGRTLGFPTLNVPWSPDLRPRFGVYAVELSGPKVPDRFRAVANYGIRPTVEETSEPRLETHVLGPCPFGEGDSLHIEWLQFLRPEQKFADLNELRTQIGRDRDAADAILPK